jgi:ribosomal protein S18 acetylase RimI-like enzyme
MSTTFFREAKEADLPAIVAMLADDDLGRGRESSTSDSTYARAFEEVRRSGDNRVLVAERDGQVIACLQLTIIPGLSRQGAKRGQIEAVRVSAAARGGGVGEELMRHAIALAKADDCRLVQLTSDKQRARAHDFYRRLGFVPSHEGFKLELQS